MKVHIQQIQPEGLHLEGEDPPSIIGLHEEQVSFDTPVRYDVMASLTGQSVLVQGRLWTEVKLNCGRCLKRFSEELQVTEFVAHREFTGQEEVDLTEEVREDIILALPGYPLCHEECKGLCPTCGQNLNARTCQCSRTAENPRWAALDEAWRATQTKKDE